MEEISKGMVKADKRVAITLLMNMYKKRYWDKTVKERLARVTAVVDWLNLNLPYWS